MKDLTQLVKKVTSLGDKDKDSKKKPVKGVSKQLSNLEVLNILINSSNADAALKSLESMKIQSKDVREYVEASLGKREPNSKEELKDDGEILKDEISEMGETEKEDLEYIEFYKRKILKVESIK